MATCLAETILETASLSGFTKLSEEDKLYVMLQSIYEASGSSDDLDTLMEAAKTAGFSKIDSERYKACILLQLMVNISGTTTAASQILSAAALSQFMFLSESAKKAAFLQMMCDYNDVDPNAAAFIAAAGITDSTEQAAIIALVEELKAGDLWTGGVALYPIVGGTTAKNAFNLFNPSAYEITWVGTPVSGSAGIRSDGTAYGRTGITRADLGTAYSTAFYQGEASSGGFDMAISSYFNPGAGGAPREHSTYDVASTLFVRFSEGVDYLAVSAGAAGNTGLTAATCSGTVGKLFRRTTQLGSDLSITNSLSADPTSEFGVLARWNGSTASLQYNKLISLFAFYSEDISGKLAAFNTAIENFQTALGRAA